MPSERLAHWLVPELRTASLQYGRFVVVGLGATLVHVAVYVATIELAGVAPLAANALGFATAVTISFLGHQHWTFRDAPGESGRNALLRFWGVALLGFLLNTLFVQLVTGTLGWSYDWAIPPMVAITPVITFLLSKLWVFRA